MGANINGFIDWRGIADGEGLVWNAARNSFLPGAVGGGISTVENGLTLSAGVLKLGGPLTENTSIGGAGFDLEMAGFGNFNISSTGQGSISANLLAITGSTKGESFTGSYLGNFQTTYGLSAGGAIEIGSTGSGAQVRLYAAGASGNLRLDSLNTVGVEANNDLTLESLTGRILIDANESGGGQSINITTSSEFAGPVGLNIRPAQKPTTVGGVAFGATWINFLEETTGGISNNTARFDGVLLRCDLGAGYSGTVTTVRHLEIGNATLGGGAITDQIGLYIQGLTSGTTNNYAIYTNAGVCRFGDDTEIVGNLTAGNALSITGSRGGNAALASLLTQLATTGIIVDNTTA